MEILARITYEESEAVNEIYEKKYALINLEKVLKVDKSKGSLCNKCLKEYQQIDNEYQKWWDNIIKKYHLELYLNRQININTISREIQLL